MSIKGYLFLLSFIVVAVYVVVIYNNLVQLKNSVAKAWSNIDVLLMQRHDELPNLVETCKQYMLYEQQTLLRVIQARAAVSDARQHASTPASMSLARPSSSFATVSATCSRWPRSTLA